MADTKQEWPPLDKAIGDLLGITQCLLIVRQIDNYVQWLRDYHHSEITSRYFLGYKILFSTLLRMLTSAIEDNTSLRLSEDDIFSRARFRGIYIHKLPNSCEKTIILKNILSYSNKVEKSNNWETFSTAVNEFTNAVLYPLDQIRKVSVVNPQCRELDIDSYINYASIFQVYIFLNDTSRGIPHGYTPSMLEDQISYRRTLHEAFANSFDGYKFGVQYLWFCLLKDKFQESVLNDIHKTDNPESFDKYFDLIKKEIVNPIEYSTGASMGFDYFILINEDPKPLLERLIDASPPEVTLSFKEYLQKVFLWYPIKLIDSSEYSFSGAALIPLMMGLIQIKRRRNDKSKAKVIRIIHGEEEAHRRNYSYAVLLEVGGYISDASGWMLFYDCCSDRGSTSGFYTQIETLIYRYYTNGFIDIDNIRVDQQEFLALIREEFLE